MKEHFLFPEGVVTPNSVDISEISDRAFEIAVYDAINTAIRGEASLAEPPKVELTKKSADRGRDILVRDYPLDSIFGLKFKQSRSKRTVVVECKLTSRKRLTLDHVAANVLQLEKEPGSVFLLVTNATLTPRAANLIGRRSE